MSRQILTSKRAISAGLALGLLVMVFAAVPARAATALFPNLKTLPPRDLRFATTSIDGTSHNVLRFSNTVWNEGPGTLEVLGEIDPVTLQGPAIQRVFDDAGGHTDYTIGEYHYHAAHDHYHFDDWGRYQLWTKADYDAWVASGGTVGSPILGSKTTSCVLDEEFIRQVPRQPYPPIFDFNGCQPDANWELDQGLSPGWGDTYDYFRPDQYVDLGPGGSLPDGQYVLRSVSDPLNKIYESPGKSDPNKDGDADNAAITNFSVQGGNLVDSNAPSGSVFINNTDSGTANPNVTVKVLGRDDISGVTQLRLSNDGSTWLTPQAYTGSGSTPQSVAWDLTNPTYGGTNTDGTKTVYVQFKDASGRWSSTESDTISLDRTGGSSAYANDVLGDSPAAYWRFGESSGSTAVDATGAGHNGTYMNGPQLGQTSLLPGDAANNAVRFDGANDYVRVPSAAQLSPSSLISLEAWIKPASLSANGSYRSIITKPGSYSLQFNGPRLEFTMMRSGTRYRAQAAAGAIQAGQTYHVVGTYDGATQRLYVNGTAVASVSRSVTMSTNTNPLTIGSLNGKKEFFAGSIDEPAVYTSPLSASQVSAHYTAGVGGPPPDPTVDAPSGLTATAVSDTGINLEWADNADNEDEFLIERDTDSTFSSPTTLVAWANTTSFADTSLSPNTTYYYRVKAKNATDSSAWSNTASATTLAAPPPATYRAEILADAPVSYWRLGEGGGTTAADEEGANPGTYLNSPSLGVPSLLAADSANTAVSFDGTNDDVRVADSASLQLTSPLTLEAWIRPDTLPGSGSFASVLTKPGSYSLQFNGPRLEFTIIQSGSSRRLQAPSGMIQAGQAYHVVGTYDGVTQRLYVNGAQVANQPLTGGASTSTNRLFIGSWNATREFLDGTIDEAAVYGTALNAGRVGAHYSAGAG